MAACTVLYRLQPFQRLPWSTGPRGLFQEQRKEEVSVFFLLLFSSYLAHVKYETGNHLSESRHSRSLHAFVEAFVCPSVIVKGTVFSPLEKTGSLHLDELKGLGIHFKCICT